MDHEQVRLRCLELALDRCGNDGNLAICLAGKFSDFVLGTNDSEIIGAARDFAKQVNDAR